jgi:hypothetical protein
LSPILLSNGSDIVAAKANIGGRIDDVTGRLKPQIPADVVLSFIFCELPRRGSR